jgi:hypothetical protein
MSVQIARLGENRVGRMRDIGVGRIGVDTVSIGCRSAFS